MHSKLDKFAMLTWPILVRAGQIFLSKPTGSNLLSAVSTYGMGDEGSKSSGLYLACLLSVA